jgi:glycosyltransferase involved in cell wall biosynthesis
MLPSMLARIAVVVPCHDDGETLPETLASLREQEAHELVIVDDGSTDASTLALLEALEQRGVRIVHQEQRGLSAARMAGVHATSAPYVFPLDSDDAVEAGSLARLADALDASPEAAAAWGDERSFGEVAMSLPSARRLDPWQLSYQNELPVAALYRRDALLDAGGWQLNIGGYEDWDLWMALAERGASGVYVPAVVGRYRVRRSRMLGALRDRHGELYAELRRRHPRLFAERRRNWLRSRAPLRLRLLLPLLDVLPLSQTWRHRLANAVSRPAGPLLVRLQRLRA